MAKIFIIHGTLCNPDSFWYPWLKNELEKLGHKVFAPKFPTPKGQNLKSWLKVFEPYKKYLDKDSILIGHSIGPIFLLSVLEGLRKPVKAAFFVATGLQKENPSNIQKLVSTFVNKEFGWKRIRANCKHFFLYHSDNDPYVPLEKAKEVADKLGVKVTLVKGAGHFNSASGYDKFELLLEDVKKIL